MATAILLSEYGGPQALKIEHVDVAAPGPGELRIRQTAIGVNFHDVYVRSGLYKTLTLPGIPGIEAAGVVEAIGPQVTGFSTGDSIAYITNHYGAYASERILPARLAIRLPDAIDQDLAASVLLKGLTAQMLLRQVHQVQSGDTILVHAASGGVGQLLCQWASYLGATVIGTVGSQEKAEQRAPWVARTLFCIARKISWSGCVRSPTIRGSMLFMTLLARTRSWAHWPRWPDGAIWLISDNLRAASTRLRCPSSHPNPIV